MEPSRKPSNFENFRAKAALFPVKVKSSDAHGNVLSASLMWERMAASDSTGIPGVTRCNRLLNTQALSYCPSMTGQDKSLKFPNFTFLPSQATFFDRSQSGNCDLGARKRCATTVDFLAEVPDRCQKLSHSITKPDANSEKFPSIFRMRPQLQICGNNRSHTQSTSSFFVQGNIGIQLKEMNTGPSEGTRNFQHIGSSRFTVCNNISAAYVLAEETLTAGATYAASDKGNNNPIGSSSENKLKSFGETGIPWKEAANKQLVALPIPASSASSRSATSSRARKVHVLELPFPKSCFLEDDYGEQRWVKRLKPSSSSPVWKTPKLPEGYFSNKTWKIFRSMDHSIAGYSESSISGRYGEGATLNHQIVECPKGVAVTGDDDKNEQQIAFSHFWIKRLRRNELDRKQLSSIAAMVVVGRTTSGWGSCGLRKMGSITIW